MNNRLFAVLAVICFAASGLQAEKITKTGTTAASFLAIDAGARATGMGGAFVSVADDITAMYWNVAGIAAVRKSAFTFTKTRWIADVDYNYAGLVMNLGASGVVGLNAAFLTMDDMERTTILEPDGTGERFGAGSHAFGLSYARNLTDRFVLGATLKYISESIYHSQADGVAFDIGTLFTTQLSGLKIGMSISNYGTKMQLSGQDMLLQADIDPAISGNNGNINAHLQTDRYDLPLLFRVGAAIDLLKGRGGSNLILAVDALHPNDDSESINVGGEYTLRNTLSLRAGYKSIFRKDSEEGLCLGFGLQQRLKGALIVSLDYAWASFGLLDTVQMFSLNCRY